MKLFRSLKRYFRDAAKSVVRNFSLSLASISCITITLIVVAISIVLSYNVEAMAKHVSSNISIVVFIDGKASEDDVKQVESDIKRIDNVDSITFKSKKEYAEETKNLDERFSLIVDSWTDETIPLLDSYEVKVKNIDDISNTASEIKKIANVSSVNFGEEYIESVITILLSLLISDTSYKNNLHQKMAETIPPIMEKAMMKLLSQLKPGFLARIPSAIAITRPVIITAA